jgi:hypothetical protein
MTFDRIAPSIRMQRGGLGKPQPADEIVALLWFATLIR